MSDTSMGPGWWQASDGRWYPPRESTDAPGPGWWLAADGRWYPPREADVAPAPGWWLAADGRWYPPADDPEADRDLVEAPPSAPAEPEADTTPAPAAAPEPAPAPAPRAAAKAEPSPRPATPSPPPATPTQNGSNGTNGLAPPTDVSEQIRQRNQASRDDAITQFPARFLAAARAVQLLEDELALAGAEPAQPAPKKHERKGRARAEAMAAEARAAKSDTSPAETTATAPASTNGTPTVEPAPAPAAVEPPAPEPEPEPEPEPAPTVPVGRPTTRPGEEQGWPAPRPAQPVHPPVAHSVGQPGGPLIELRPSALGADLDHLGDRLLVFEDRVELRDRGDHVRQAVAGSAIAEVAVQRKFTGAVLTISGLDAPPIVVKGIKPEQADEVQRLIQTRLRHPDGMPDRDALEVERPADVPARDAPPEESALAAPSPDAVANAADRLAILNRNRLNEAELLRKLADLHRAGVLSDAEFSDKIALVGRLVSGETIVVV